MDGSARRVSLECLVRQIATISHWVLWTCLIANLGRFVAVQPRCVGLRFPRHTPIAPPQLPWSAQESRANLCEIGQFFVGVHRSRAHGACGLDRSRV
jgi:hypothetical protein